MNPLQIIEKYYKKDSELYHILVEHSTAVANKALWMIDNHPELNADSQFAYEAAMLHDIGIFMTDAPRISCYGTFPYIAHGYLGTDLLTKEGLPRHALVCERHTGAGLTADEIRQQNLPIPHREMMPIGIEEQLVCFADCFFSKTKLGQEATIETLRAKMERFGERSVKQFDTWCQMFLSP